MAGLLVESFGWLATDNDIANRGWVVSEAGKWFADASGGPDGQPALRVTNGDGASITRPLARTGSGTTLRIAGYVKTTVNYVGDNTPAFRSEILFGVFNIADNVNLCIGLNSGGLLTLCRMESNSTLTIVGTGTTIIDTGDWFRVEIEILIDASAGVAKLWVNGIQEIDLSGVDTQDTTGGVEVFTHFILGCADGTVATNNSIFFSDFVVWDEGGSEFTGEFGNKVHKIKYIQPDSTGTTTDFTPSTGANFENVDEVGIDADTTYNESSVSTNRDIFNYEAISVTLDEIFTVSSTSIVRNTDVGAIDARNVNKSSAVITPGPTYTINTTNYGDTVLEQVLDNNPNTSAQWTETTVDAAEFGYENI